MLNADVIDLYSRADVGTKIIVLPNYHNVAGFAPQISHPRLWSLRPSSNTMRIDELAPGLRADQIIGMEVRGSDDKIVGEVRNIVFGTKDRRDYAIVASGGFFTPGKDSIVVPIQSPKVSRERVSFFLPISKETMTKVPLMPDQEYKWLSDKKWRARNDAIFRGN